MCRAEPGHLSDVRCCGSAARTTFERTPVLRTRVRFDGSAQRRGRFVQHGYPAVMAQGEGARFTHESERLVWERLARGVAEGTVLLPNIRLTSQRKDHELDVVVLMPGVGVVVVEVKGGSVSVDAQGQWWTGGGTRRSPIRPVDQCRDGKYALRAFVEDDPRWRGRHSRVRWGHAIVLPYTDVADDFATPGCPRWMVSGRGDLDDLAGPTPRRVRAAGEHPAG